jgi:hypothetical protein
MKKNVFLSISFTVSSLSKKLLEELRVYRNEDEEEREMTSEGIYDNELKLAEKLGILIENQ